MLKSPITFALFDGDGSSHGSWVATDVAFKRDACNATCISKPTYSDAARWTPFFVDDDAGLAIFASAYLPAP